VRYQYLAYKYTRRMRRDISFAPVWEEYWLSAQETSMVWRPRTDMYETDKEIIIVMELAGVREDDMTISLFTDLLVVEGQRRSPVADMNACHQLGIKYGKFISEIDVHSAVNHENVIGTYQNGLLTITLKKVF